MIDQYFLVLTTIDLFVLTFMCILTKLSETLNSKQKRGFFLAFVLIGVISILEVITILVDGAPVAHRHRRRHFGGRTGPRRRGIDQHLGAPA